MTLENAAAQVHSYAPTGDAAVVHARFLRQVQAENAHDIAGIDAVLAPEIAGSEDAPMFIARAGQFFGRKAVLQRFRDNFAGIWKFEPEIAEIRITPIGTDTIHLFAPTRITVGPAGEAPRTLLFLVNQIAVRTERGWRFAVIIPVPTA